MPELLNVNLTPSNAVVENRFPHEFDVVDLPDVSGISAAKKSHAGTEIFRVNFFTAPTDIAAFCYHLRSRWNCTQTWSPLFLRSISFLPENDLSLTSDCRCQIPADLICHPGIDDEEIRKLASQRTKSIETLLSEIPWVSGTDFKCSHHKFIGHHPSHQHSTEEQITDDQELHHDFPRQNDTAGSIFAPLEDRGFMVVGKSGKLGYYVMRPQSLYFVRGPHAACYRRDRYPFKLAHVGVRDLVSFCFFGNLAATDVKGTYFLSNNHPVSAEDILRVADGVTDARFRDSSGNLLDNTHRDIVKLVDLANNYVSRNWSSPPLLHFEPLPVMRLSALNSSPPSCETFQTALPPPVPFCDFPPFCLPPKLVLEQQSPAKRARAQPAKSNFHFLSFHETRGRCRYADCSNRTPTDGKPALVYSYCAMCASRRTDKLVHYLCFDCATHPDAHVNASPLDGGNLVKFEKNHICDSLRMISCGPMRLSKLPGAAYRQNVKPCKICNTSTKHCCITCHVPLCYDSNSTSMFPTCGSCASNHDQVKHKN